MADKMDPRGPHALFGLRSAAFPSDAPAHPDAVAYLPAAPGGPLSVIVYLHGHENCAENVMGEDPGVCAPDHEPDHGKAQQAPAADLIGQLVRAERDALLIVPELRYNARSSDPGALGAPGALSALIDEVLERLGDVAGTWLGGARVADVAHVTLISHSGGYRAAAALCTIGTGGATGGGAPVRELILLDSLYGCEDEFARFAQGAVASLQAGGPTIRLRNLYGESTRDRSRALARRVAAQVAAAGLPPSTLVQDDHTLDLTEEQLAAPLLSKRVATAHSDLPRTYLHRLLLTGDLRKLSPRDPSGSSPGG